MPDPLLIEGTEDKLSITLDAEKGVFEFHGRSLPDDPNMFFQPVKEWIKEYVKNPNESTVLNCHIDYLNTASLGVFIGMFSLFEKIQEQNKKIQINWIIEEGDILLEDRGSELQMILKVPLEIIRQAQKS